MGFCPRSLSFGPNACKWMDKCWCTQQRLTCRFKKKQAMDAHDTWVDLRSVEPQNNGFKALLQLHMTPPLPRRGHTMWNFRGLYMRRTSEGIRIQTGPRGWRYGKRRCSQTQGTLEKQTRQDLWCQGAGEDIAGKLADWWSHQGSGFMP